jgi:hydrogenase expression/formation protein HypE
MLTTCCCRKARRRLKWFGNWRRIFSACRSLGISVIGGHTEITHGLANPILVATLIGEVERERLITPRGASEGDTILLTKGVPIEGTAILAQEFPNALVKPSARRITRAARFLYDPGISVLRDAQIAVESGEVTAMHDPTEGGLSAALWELAEASGHSLVVDMVLSRYLNCWAHLPLL